MLYYDMNWNHPPSHLNFSHSPDRASAASRNSTSHGTQFVHAKIAHPRPKCATLEATRLREISAPISPAFSISFGQIKKSAQLSENKHFQLPFLSHSCALFCWKPFAYYLFPKTTEGIRRGRSTESKAQLEILAPSAASHVPSINYRPSFTRAAPDVTSSPPPHQSLMGANT
jgi:hypothetical protein